MSYKNIEDSSPLVACYNSASQSTSGLKNNIMSINASLFSGEISGGNTVTLNNQAALMGDVYGYSPTSLGFWCSFHLDDVRQYQGLDVCSSIDNAVLKATEHFFANSSVDDQIKSEWRINSGAGSGVQVYIEEGYPRLTGVLLK